MSYLTADGFGGAATHQLDACAQRPKQREQLRAPIVLPKSGFHAQLLSLPWVSSNRYQPRAINVKRLILAAAYCFLLLGPEAKAEQYRIVSEEWAPYNYMENNHLSGIAADIVRRIMAQTGDDFEMVMLPSMRTIHVLNTRPKTIMYTMFRTPEREPLYKWVGPLVEAAIHPYQLANAPQAVDTLRELLSAPKITTRHAGLVPEMLESQGFNNLDKSAARSLQLYRMLLAGRADIIIGDTDAGVAHYSRQLNISPGTLRKIPVEIYQSPLYIAFSRDCEDELVATWASALEHLRRSGELERIVLTYKTSVGR